MRSNATRDRYSSSNHLASCLRDLPPSMINGSFSLRARSSDRLPTPYSWHWITLMLSISSLRLASNSEIVLGALMENTRYQVIGRNLIPHPINTQNQEQHDCHRLLATLYQ